MDKNISHGFNACREREKEEKKRPVHQQEVIIS
jgi:hypothetical protein